MRTCTTPGCDKPHRAKGLCNTHYGQQNPNRHRPRTAPCAWCGVPVTGAGGGGRKYGASCSTQCRRYLAYGKTPSPSRELALAPRPPRTDQRPRPTRRPRKYFGGTCPICGATFLSPHTRMTCSPPCQAARDADVRRDHKHRYRARRRAAYVAPVSPLAIYRRDNWTCRLCGDPIDPNADPHSPLAPSLDHIIPLANGGTHEPSNTWAAHIACNAERSNKPYVTTGRARQRIPSLF